MILWIALDGGNTVDYLGVNYYQPPVCAASLCSNPAPYSFEQFYEPYVMPGRKINLTVVGKSMIRPITKISRKPRQYRVDFDRKMEMGVEGEENSARMGYPDDLPTILLVKDHSWAQRVIQDGATKGYLIWTLRWLLQWLQECYGLVECSLGHHKNVPQKNPPLVPEGSSRMDLKNRKNERDRNRKIR